MKLILLPGMDGTGLLFKPLLKALPSNISTQLITYPGDQKLSYKKLFSYVQDKLPKDTEFVLLAESFSGPIAYDIAKHENVNLTAIIFVASFIQSPNKLLALTKIIPLSFLMPNCLPDIVLRFLMGSSAEKYHYKLINNALAKVKNEVLAFRLLEMAKLPKNTSSYINRSIYIQAMGDNLVSSKNAVTISQLSKKFQLHRVEGSHFILQVNPEKCSEIIKNEINRLSTSAE